MHFFTSKIITGLIARRNKKQTKTAQSLVLEFTNYQLPITNYHLPITIN